ncbi:hypothetical protein [Sediminivirga luteola]|uniref:Uncharacterized protein n=1 Tax=Sediminivirga luteola TaxID=1774748 RepID=A0A8J2XJ23_9MICO|nr:hypothetical protein [Sediminivirga luteola]MCI2265947.1 hypothetical protein [Sediminivirga luteola]GGA03632.1 hypothetical protein GCM10011333_02960 [Sediminivirga luteola]
MSIPADAGTGQPGGTSAPGSNAAASAHGQQAADSPVDRTLTAAAVVLTVAASLALAGVILIGLFAPPAPAVLTWTAMVGFPLAFALLIAIVIRAIGRRRKF